MRRSVVYKRNARGAGQHLAVQLRKGNADRRIETVTLAERYFSAPEFSHLRALPAWEQSRQFFAYWTLKESYTKARGLGLTIPINRFSFSVEDEIKIVFDSSFTDDAASWRFALLDGPPHHMIGVSVKTGGAALILRAKRVVPLREDVKLA